MGAIFIQHPSQKITLHESIVVHDLILKLQRQSQADFCELKASLSYILGACLKNKKITHQGAGEMAWVKGITAFPESL